MPTILTLLLAVVAGAALWTLGEYLLHRFAMHELRGRGLLSREHLEHHVKAQWGFDPLIVLAWVGVILVGASVWAPLGWLALGPIVGIGLGSGWILGYGCYELLHARAHLRAPRNRYAAWLRRHHFHHHFGHPMANHGVTTDVWDRLFGTLEVPERVRVPRRLAMAWLLDERSELRPEFRNDYELVGGLTTDERTLALDRARAFASAAPTG